jgi:hypothetical protein
VNLIGASGKEAPQFFKLLAKLTEFPDVGAVKSSTEAEVRAKLIPEITAQVTSALMEKFKAGDPMFSLNKVPGAPVPGALNVVTEKDYEKLTPEEQQRWLAGEL